jgi:hypothetical protein
LTQFTLAQNRFYHKLTVAESEGEASKNTFLFYAMPNSIHFAVAYWRIQYLIANCFHVQNSHVFVALLGSMVDHLFQHDVPTQMKELILALLSQLMWTGITCLLFIHLLLKLFFTFSFFRPDEMIILLFMILLLGFLLAFFLSFFLSFYLSFFLVPLSDS